MTCEIHIDYTIHTRASRIIPIWIMRCWHNQISNDNEPQPLEAA